MKSSLKKHPALLAILFSAALAVQASAAAKKLPSTAALPLGALPAMPAPAAPVLPLASPFPVVSPVDMARAGVTTQLEAMRRIVGPDHEPLLRSIGDTAKGFLREIEGHIDAGALDPAVDLRTHAGDSEKKPANRYLRVGVYPVAADPFHWGHMLVGLQAIAKLKLDKVVFVLAGDDVRKPKMTPADIRHPMGRALLDAFHPFFAYSPIALGTSYDGETNVFRLLALNPAQAMRAYYLVGDDHYRATDKHGNPDTLGKIEANMLKPELAFDPVHHGVSVAFNERDGHTAHNVPTSLEVEFLPHVGFEASSTQIRNGHQALMPYVAYEWVRSRALGLYGITQ